MTGFASVGGGRLRLADIDANGYPDILATVEEPAGVSRAYLLLNKSPAGNATARRIYAT